MQIINRKLFLCLSFSVGVLLTGFATSERLQAGFFGGALGGAILGGIIDGGDGAAAGAIIGGIGGAVRSSSRRRDARNRQQAYYEREREERRRMQEQRLQMERDRNRAVEQQAAANSPQGKMIRQTQSALTLMGFDVGAADGKLNKATVDAIRAYQNSYKLLATGQPSDALLAHMRKNL